MGDQGFELSGTSKGWAIAGVLFMAVVLSCSWLHENEAKSQREGIKRNEEVARRAVAAIESAPASEHIKAGEAALKSERTSDARPPLVVPGQPAPKPSISESQWETTRKRLKLVFPDQPEFHRAQQLLKAMDDSDKRKALADAKNEAIAEVKARKAYAPILEQRFIEKRINADVKTFGKDATTLWIKWVLASKVTAHDLSKSGVLEEAERLGFKKVEFTDGYDLTWSWKL